MFIRAFSSSLVVAGLFFVGSARAQEVIPAPTPAQRGVEVLARGPIHEAFATPTGEARPAQPVPRKPPAPVEELPPEERPEGDVVWIAGYWGWDDDRQDFLWVSGCWRIKPAGKEWLSGYWRETGEQWQWVAGFWAAVQDNRPQQLTYYPQPPAPPQIAPPAEPPSADQFYVPGHWLWLGDRYGWRAGYWTRIRPGHVYVASHYQWTPSGYVFAPGYWDLAVSRRGLLYAPVIVDPVLAGPTFVFTPSYAVSDTIVLDALFIRPAQCQYYFGDYYGPRYVDLGFESCVVYSRRHYEPIVVYQRWEYRDNPRWHDTQVNLYFERSAGRAPVPPRTLVQQNIVVNNVTNVTNVTVNNIQRTNVLVSTRNVLDGRGQRPVALDAGARAQVQRNTQAVQQAVTTHRRQVESANPAAPVGRPHVSTLTVPAAPAAAVVTALPPARPSNSNNPAHPPFAPPPGVAPHVAGPQALPPHPANPNNPAHPAFAPPSGVAPHVAGPQGPPPHPSNPNNPAHPAFAPPHVPGPPALRPVPPRPSLPDRDDHRKKPLPPGG